MQWSVGFGDGKSWFHLPIPDLPSVWDESKSFNISNTTVCIFLWELEISHFQAHSHGGRQDSALLGLSDSSVPYHRKLSIGKPAFYDVASEEGQRKSEKDGLL